MKKHTIKVVMDSGKTEHLSMTTAEVEILSLELCGKLPYVAEFSTVEGKIVLSADILSAAIERSQ